MWMFLREFLQHQWVLFHRLLQNMTRGQLWQLAFWLPIIEYTSSLASANLRLSANNCTRFCQLHFHQRVLVHRLQSSHNHLFKWKPRNVKNIFYSSVCQFDCNAKLQCCSITLCSVTPHLQARCKVIWVTSSKSISAQWKNEEVINIHLLVAATANTMNEEKKMNFSLS